MSGGGCDTTAAIALPLPPVQYYGAYSEETRARDRPAPPQPPLPHDTYAMFGNAFCDDDPIIQPLEGQGIRRLYPLNFEHRKELKKLNHSVLANFLDLLEILVRCPDSNRRVEKIDDIKLLFIHMHHLINEFRPHQAREALRVTLELQKRKRFEIADRFESHLDKVREMITDALQNVTQHDSSSLSSQSAAAGNAKLLARLSTLSTNGGDVLDAEATAGRHLDQADTADADGEETERDALLCAIVDNMT